MIKGIQKFKVTFLGLGFVKFVINVDYKKEMKNQAIKAQGYI